MKVGLGDKKTVPVEILLSRLERSKIVTNLQGMFGNSS